jgi:hypothetical protein
MSYIPNVNDYVFWNDGKGIEGWVYFKDKEYITIEVAVRPKDEQNYLACSIHKNERVLVICYHHQWNQLEYVKSRKSKYEEEQNCLAMVGKSDWGKGK